MSTSKFDLTTTKGCKAALAQLAEQAEKDRAKLGQLNTRRESLALEAAGGDEKALADLRAWSEEHALVTRSIDNINAAKTAATQRLDEAEERERIATLHALYDEADECCREILGTTEEISEAADRLVEALKRRKAAGERLQGTRVADDATSHYVVSGQGTLDHLAALGLRDLVQGFTHMAGDRLEQRDPTVVRLPSREHYLRMNGVTE